MKNKRLYGSAFALLLAIVTLLQLGCHRAGTEANGNLTSQQNATHVFHFGHQHGGDILLKSRGILAKKLAEKGYTVDYVEFPAGPQLLEALSVGSIDLGATGESPPIFAQAAGSSLVYAANNPPSSDSGEGQAILVPAGSPIHTIQDLKGKRIAFQKASSAHNFVIQIVERAGLTYKDIEPVYLSPPDAQSAFNSGRIDAWAIWDPFLTIAQQKTGGHVLVNSKGIKSAGGFYLASRSFANQHLDIIKIALQEISDSNAWAYDHPEESGKLRQKITGIDANTWKIIQSHAVRTGIVPVTDKVVEAQQLTADNYYKIGLLPKRINIRDAVLTPEQYAQIIPVDQTIHQIAKKKP